MDQGPFRRFLKWTERYTKTDMVYLVKNASWLNLNFAFVSIFSFLLSIAFANILTKTEYGMYQYILSIASLLAAFTLTGFNAAITRSVARGHDGTLMASIRPQLLWNLVPAAAALVWSGYYFVLGQSTLGFGVLAVGLSLPIINTFNSYGAYLAGKKAFRESALYAMCGNAAYYLCIFGGIFLVPKAIPLVFINLFVTAGVAAFLYFHTIRRFRPTGTADPEAPPYARHISLMNALRTAAEQVDNLLVFHYIGAAGLATYSIASLLPERMGGAFRSVIAIAMPRFAERDLASVKENLGRRLFFFFLATIGAAAVYMLIAPFVFELVYPKYTDAIGYSQLYALTLVSFVGSLVASVLLAHRRIRELYVLNAGLPILQIGIQLGAILLWGLWGLVAAKVASALILSVTALVLVYRATPPSSQ